MNSTAISVKQLNIYVKGLIESDTRLSYISVCGEISNFKNHYASGHWYFTLKDSEAQVKCIMFSSYASRVPFLIEDGMQVVLTGRVSLYERDGLYQLYAESIRPLGEGGLAVSFNILKEKLQKEGLFDENRKRPLNRFPKKIAVITSDTGAAVKDIINILSIRYPICDVLLCPVGVQGENAVGSIVNMLDIVYSRTDVDTIIIGRGGGSIEDLWAFNSEILARRIFQSPIPVISAVGHETDFTICDFVADVRASTPSHAAELAVPDIRVLLSTIDTLSSKLKNALTGKYKVASAKYEMVVSKPVFEEPKAYFDNQFLKIDSIYERIQNSVKDYVSKNEKRFGVLLSRIDALNPIKIISRGFAAVKSEGSAIKSIAQLSVGQGVNLKFSDGAADCKVVALRSKEDE